MSSLVIVRRRFCFTYSLELQGEGIFFFPISSHPINLSARTERERGVLAG
jgi:hypothetical protein